MRLWAYGQPTTPRLGFVRFSACCANRPARRRCGDKTGRRPCRPPGRNRAKDQRPGRRAPLGGLRGWFLHTTSRPRDGSVSRRPSSCTRQVGAVLNEYESSPNRHVVRASAVCAGTWRCLAAAGRPRCHRPGPADVRGPGVTMAAEQPEPMADPGVHGNGYSHGNPASLPMIYHREESAGSALGECPRNKSAGSYPTSRTLLVSG